MIKNFFNGLGCFNESKVPPGKNHRRYMRTCRPFDLDEDLLQVGDPLTDPSNYLQPGYRPVVEMPFQQGEDTVYFYGVVFGYRERTDDDNMMTGDEDEFESCMNNREYMVVWSDTTLDFRSRSDVDDLLKLGPDVCVKCGEHGAELAACESCYCEWHTDCLPAWIIQSGKASVSDDEAMLCESCHKVLKSSIAQ